VGSSASITNFTITDAGGGLHGIAINSGGHIEVPVNLNQGNWTVELVCELTPSSYWAGIWGNEAYSYGKGYLAYMTGSGAIQLGTSFYTDTINLANNSVNIATRAHWVFANHSGTLSVYRNGTKLSVTMGYIPPSDLIANNLYVGSRHDNSGTGSTDTCTGTYYFVRVRDYGLDQSGATSAYTSLQSTYSL
jgi:hypothetical protein